MNYKAFNSPLLFCFSFKLKYLCTQIILITAINARMT